MLHTLTEGKDVRQVGAGGGEDPPKALKDRDNLAREMTLGTDMFASVIVGLLLGWFVGQLFGIKSPWPLLTGIALGAVAGFRETYRYIKEGIEREKEDKKEREKE
ncbi:MAG: AtpZ/AtpI family protein [Candidatus Aquicultorales bacterium]